MVLRKENLSVYHLRLKADSAQIALVSQVKTLKGTKGGCLARDLQARILDPSFLGGVSVGVLEKQDPTAKAWRQQIGWSCPTSSFSKAGRH